MQETLVHAAIPPWERWWMETAASQKATTEAKRQVESRAGVIHETREETKCQVEAEETCMAEEALHHTGVAMHENCRLYIYNTESDFWGKRLCYCITCRKYIYG
jgi:hypothetical protein